MEEKEIINYKTKLTYKGETQTINEWSKITGISPQTIIERKKRGYPDYICLKQESLHAQSRTICWHCARAAGWMGGCNWSEYCIGRVDDPEVPGWDAIKVNRPGIFGHNSRDDGGLSYIVRECPLFIDDEEIGDLMQWV